MQVWLSSNAGESSHVFAVEISPMSRQSRVHSRSFQLETELSAKTKTCRRNVLAVPIMSVVKNET
jgi:hypothetical protein